MIIVLAIVGVFILFKFGKSFSRKRFAKNIKELPNAYNLETRRSKSQWRGGF
jgi:hypothetical protein